MTFTHHKWLLIGLGLFFGVAPAIADAGEPPVEEAAYTAYADLLRIHVRDGVVDYAGLSADERRLDDYLHALARTDPNSLSRNEEIAFWINAYNAFTLKLILNHSPGIASIKEIRRSERWKGKLWRVGDRTYSHDGIEHDILRKMDEPRIHFALVCAALSCPDLRGEPYAAKQLEAQLDDQVRRFLADERKGMRIDEEAGEVRLSKIFDWFGGDFESEAPSVLDYVLPFAPDEARRWIEANRNDLKVEHLPYDWELNGPPPER